MRKERYIDEQRNCRGTENNNNNVFKFNYLYLQSEQFNTIKNEGIFVKSNFCGIQFRECESQNKTNLAEFIFAIDQPKSLRKEKL